MPALSQERVDEIFDGAADFKQLEYEKAEAKEEQVYIHFSYTNYTIP